MSNSNIQLNQSTSKSKAIISSESSFVNLNITSGSSSSLRVPLHQSNLIGKDLFYEYYIEHFEQPTTFNLVDAKNEAAGVFCRIEALQRLYAKKSFEDLTLKECRDLAAGIESINGFNEMVRKSGQKDMLSDFQHIVFAYEATLNKEQKILNSVLNLLLMRGDDQVQKRIKILLASAVLLELFKFVLVEIVRQIAALSYSRNEKIGFNPTLCIIIVAILYEVKLLFNIVIESFCEVGYFPYSTKKSI